MLKIALMCGGPSLERGISLNSARSVLDHLSSSVVEIIPIYINSKRDFYRISTDQLYSNTPADFDFKLQSLAKKLDLDNLKKFLKEVDLVFPVIHGELGEDGEIQELLEKFNVFYVGSDAKSCRKMFNKYNAAQILKAHNLYTLPSLLINLETLDIYEKISCFFQSQKLVRAIVKPTKGGSSIGVFSVLSSEEAYAKVKEIFSQKIDTQVLIEPFCKGKEFTVMVMQNHMGKPIALLPTQIEMDYSNNQIFDYRRKYLPTNQVTYYTPANFDLATINVIRNNAEKIFNIFGMRDFVRLDGWVLDNGEICFTDFNPVSGLEQNSFLFRQTSILGLTHQQTLNYIIKNVCLRVGLSFETSVNLLQEASQLVYVLFGNNNAERQVSLMSGTNVWLKLLHSQKLKPIPCLFDPEQNIWELPYSVALNHTVEEVYENCLNASEIYKKFNRVISKICHELAIEFANPISPRKQSLETFFHKVKKDQAFVFIAMHGGIAENGTLQKLLESHQIHYNGTESQSAALCMDKYLTGLAINDLAESNLISLPKVDVDFVELISYSQNDLQLVWTNWCEKLDATTLIIKPRSDGCSAGIVVLKNYSDLVLYSLFLSKHATSIPAKTFSNQNEAIDLPSFLKDSQFIIEPYIETDLIEINDHLLTHTHKTGWIELTVGVRELAGQYSCFNPSITIAEGAVLSLEEKFQGGTGINLTPPPYEIVSFIAIEHIKKQMQKVAHRLNIRSYARIDFFYNCQSKKIIIIEANTLPALTPSTVLYHQALAETPPLTPKLFIESLIIKQHDLCIDPHV